LSPVLTPTASTAGVNPPIPTTDTGILEPVVELLPNWPSSLLPQHFALPSAITAHDELSPVLTLTAVRAGVNPSITTTSTGIVESPAELLPNWPSSLLPQHFTVPPNISAHE
jgi:hypothetical protein